MNEELDFRKLLQMSRDEILRAFRLPPIFRASEETTMEDTTNTNGRIEYKRGRPKDCEPIAAQFFALGGLSISDIERSLRRRARTVRRWIELVDQPLLPMDARERIVLSGETLLAARRAAIAQGKSVQEWGELVIRAATA